MINPAFSLNFTTESLDARVSFTRALATATRINSSGVIEGVAANTARFDYNPITLACKGLLIEESRINSIRYSSEFDTVPWTATALTTISTNNLAPNGTNTAFEFDDGVTGSTEHRRFQFIITTSASWTCSFYAKFISCQWVYIRIPDSANVTRFAYFDIQNGVVGSAGLGLTISITPEPNGFYRCVATVAAGFTGSSATVMGTAGSDGGASYTGSNKRVYFWGAQMELGAFPTSIIPTTTTALTRNADVATITGTDFSDFWQAGKGGASVQATPSTVSGIRPLVQFDDGTANEIIALRGNTTNPELQIVDGGTPQAAIDAGTIAANTPYSLTGWWAANDCKARQNGGAVVTDTTATIPTVTQARLGSDGTNYLNGHLATVNYYDVFSSQIYTRRKNKAVFSLL